MSAIVAPRTGADSGPELGADPAAHLQAAAGRGRAPGHPCGATTYFTESRASKGGSASLAWLRWEQEGDPSVQRKGRHMGAPVSCGGLKDGRRPRSKESPPRRGAEGRHGQASSRRQRRSLECVPVEGAARVCPGSGGEGLGGDLAGPPLSRLRSPEKKPHTRDVQGRQLFIVTLDPTKRTSCRTPAAPKSAGELDLDVRRR